MALAAVPFPPLALLHGLVGSWDEYALLLLAPLVVAAVLWVTRRRAGDDDEADDVDLD